MKISPSLMCMDLTKFQYQIESLEEHVDYYHVDIMDGHFVNNLALSSDFVKQVKNISKTKIDAHIMSDKPEIFVDQLIEYKADVISIHSEVINGKAFRLIDKIKSAGIEIGIVLNPETNLSEIKTYIEKIDLLTLMTVDPGFAGQPFIPEMVDKIKEAKKLKETNNYKYKIQVDGSCNKKTYKILSDAGTEIFILGSSGLFGLADDINESVEIMKKELEEELK